MSDKTLPEPAESPLEVIRHPTHPRPTPRLRWRSSQRERDDYYDRLLRKTAEFDNYRKRIERERREQAEQAVVDLLLELLLVVDDFDRALTVEAGRERGGVPKGRGADSRQAA